MTRVAAFDSSTWWGGVALVGASGPSDGPTVVAEVGLRVHDSHAIRMLGLLARLLAEASWERSSIDAFAATRGPGSFTGIRVGLGTVRGLALGADRPCLGVVTLEAIAEAFGPTDRDRVPLMDAGRGEVYGARYDPSGSPPRQIVAPWLGGPERALLGGPGEPAILGPGAERHEERLRAAGLTGAIRRTPSSVAAGVGRLALLRLRGGARDGEGVSPVYLRPADAELSVPREDR